MENITDKDVVARCLSAWSRGDIDEMLRWMDDDVLYRLHAGEGHLSLAGETRGKLALRPRLAEVHDVFEFLAYVIEAIRVGVDGVRTTVLYFYRHRESGLHIDGRFRHVIKLTDGLITEVDIYHDAAAVEAFFQMAKRGTRPPGGTPES